MKLTGVVVENFRALVSAEVAFGPGLNVLYGPNDFGKSTLAQAIRAALLVDPTSSTGTLGQSWYADAIPVVALTFEDDDGHYWRVKKTFKTSAHSGSAELRHSKDGLTFTLDAKSRQVEERLRALLGWGIAPPGGKGSPRGLPESFLAQTLLAAQTDVDRILGQSLAEDATDTGKVRLSKALATLAQNPTFKAILDAAQHEVDASFTPKGQLKRGQGSRFTKAGDNVRDLENQLATVRKLEDEAKACAAVVESLREEQTKRMEGVSEAEGRLNLARLRRERWGQRELVERGLQEARAVLMNIDARAKEVAASAAEVEKLEVALRSAEKDLQRAAAESGAADVALRLCEEAHRLATSEDGARERDLRLAEMKAEHADIGTRIQAAESRKAKAAGVIAARRAADEARLVASRARQEVEEARHEEAKARGDLVEHERALDVSRRLADYGRWKAAVQAVTDATDAAARAERTRAEADAVDRQADSVDDRLRQIDLDLSRTQGGLPTPERLKALLQLERDVERTEAALGGGLSVILRAQGRIAVSATVDEVAGITEETLAGERILEAERTFRLTVGDLLQVDVIAGAPEKRRELASLRSRWQAEALPALEAASLPSLSAVGEALEKVASSLRVSESARRDADALRAQAKEHRARAALYDEQAAKLADARANLAVREASIRGNDLVLLEKSFAKLGAGWETQTAASCTQQEKALAAATSRAANFKNALGVAEYRTSNTDELAKAAEASKTALAAELGPDDPEALVGSLTQEIAALSARQRDLTDAMGDLLAETSGQVQRAAEALEAARVRVAATKEAHANAATKRDQILAEHSARAGHHDAVKGQVEALNRPAAASTMKEREDAFAGFADDVPTTDADVRDESTNVETARRAADGVRTELHHAQGALSKVGGPSAAEEVTRLQDAIAAARARQEELEVDAEAYKLLRDTLRELENAEGAHLGRALAGPVASRFRELTGGRYGALSLTPTLRTEGISVVGTTAGDVLASLSVGTREQLATLLRLAIAEQLRSAIVLDDQLVQTDPKRLGWFRDVLRQTSVNAQVIVLTCRPQDYLDSDELPVETPVRDLAGGNIRAIDFSRVARRWAVVPSRPAPAASRDDAETGARIIRES